MNAQFVSTRLQQKSAILLLVIALLAIPLPAFAAPAQHAAHVTPQQKAYDPPAMILGQFVHAQAQKGEVLLYTLAIEGGGSYVLTAGDSAEAAKFDVVITDEDDKTVYEGALADPELKLKPSLYTLQFTANEDAELSAVVVGDFGQLSDDQSNPGGLFNGSYVTAEDIQGPLYAKLQIPEFDYYQLVLINLQGGDGDDYSISVYGEDTATSGSLSDGKPVQFWSKGGEYEVEISPVEGGKSLFVMVLLSGPPPILVADEDQAGELSGEGDSDYYSFEVNQAGAVVDVLASAESEDAQLDLSVSISPETATWQGNILSNQSVVRFMAPYAGTYIIKVGNNLGEGAYTIHAIEGDVAPLLPINERIWDLVKAGENNIYRLEVEDPGLLLSLIMVGSTTRDIDLRAALYDETGNALHYMTALSSSSAEIVSQTGAQAGIYEVVVSNLYSDQPSIFSLTTRLEQSLEFAAQWASEATASSAYGEENYSPAQATGALNTLIAGDYPTAWAAKEADKNEETLELTFDAPVMPAALNIYESYNPGAVSKVEAYNPQSEKWEVLWEGKAEATDSPSQVFSPRLELVGFATNQIRLTIDEPAVSGWNEIDAVQLLGLPE